jgi:uncharacterized protein YegL
MDNLNQENINEIPAIINPNESHLALLFLVNTSIAMEGEPIHQLTDGLNRFIKDINASDTGIYEILDIAIVEFNTTFNVVQEFQPVKFVKPIILTAADGETMMAPAIEKALGMIQERVRFYLRSGTAPFIPLIILVSAAEPSDDISSVVQMIKDRETAGKLEFLSLGVSGFNSRTLHTLSTHKVIKLTGTDFSDFFSKLKLCVDDIRIAKSTPYPRPWVSLFGNVTIDNDRE